MAAKKDKSYSPMEERINWVSHLVGFLLTLAMAALLITKSVWSNHFWGMLGAFFMAIGMGSSYLASTLYHAAPHGPRRRALRRFDHAAIFLSIAGSYSPFTLVLLRQQGAWGWIIFGLVWGLALLGIGLNFRPMKNTNYIQTGFYILMGWLVVIAVKPLIEAAQAQGVIESLYWLLAGGVFYTVGALIYAFVKREYAHAVFHLFVLLGGACHLWSVYLIV